MPLNFAIIPLVPTSNWVGGCFCKTKYKYQFQESDGMRCCRSDWPGLCFVVTNPCVLSANRVDFRLLFFLFHKFSNFTFLPSPRPSGGHSHGRCTDYGLRWACSGLRLLYGHYRLGTGERGDAMGFPKDIRMMGSGELFLSLTLL